MKAIPTGNKIWPKARGWRFFFPRVLISVRFELLTFFFCLRIHILCHLSYVHVDDFNNTWVEVQTFNYFMEVYILTH